MQLWIEAAILKTMCIRLSRLFSVSHTQVQLSGMKPGFIFRLSRLHVIDIAEVTVSLKYVRVMTAPSHMKAVYLSNK